MIRLLLAKSTVELKSILSACYPLISCSIIWLKFPVCVLPLISCSITWLKISCLRATPDLVLYNLADIQESLLGQLGSNPLVS